MTKPDGIPVPHLLHLLVIIRERMNIVFAVGFSGEKIDSKFCVLFNTYRQEGILHNSSSETEILFDIEIIAFTSLGRCKNVAFGLT